jgi:CMP-N-acetylneuraminic acid synthetase
MIKPKITALVPMRHNSERVKGKNYRPFAGRPLFHCILESLFSCSLIDNIVIDTDSPIIREDVKQNFPDVFLIDRPEHLKEGNMPMNEVLAWDISKVDDDFFLQTHSTNPLLSPETIKRAIEIFLKQYPFYDSLFSVTRKKARLWDSVTRPVNHNPRILLRTQDLPPLFEENSNLYIFTRESLEKYHSRIGRRPLMFEMDRLEATDIDEELDFQIAEFLYLKRKQIITERKD